jgi:hypothetical protein
MSPLARHLEIASSTLDQSVTFSPRGRLIGREIEVAQILALFERGERLATLIGWTGQGKTRLARGVAETWKQGGADRVVRFVDLARETNVAEVIDQAASALEPTLLVIDSGDKFDAAISARVDEALKQSLSLRVLATSRRPIGLAAEMRYWLAPLSIAAGVELFLDRAGASTADSDRELAEKIVELLGGHPWSIELAARQSDVLSFAELFARLSADRFSVLRPIEAAIEKAVAELPAREEEVLSKCAAIGESFTLAEAEAVFKSDTHAQVGLIELLRSLVLQSLLLPLATGTGPRRFVYAPSVRVWLTAAAAPSDRPVVEVNMEKRTIRVGRKVIALRRRRAPWLVIAQLIAEREARPGSSLDVRALTEAGWPGERISTDAAAARVYFVIRELRKAGLENILLTVAEGYLLDPAVDIVRT